MGTSLQEGVKERKTLRPPQSALHRNATVHGQRGPCLIYCFQNLLGIKLIVALFAEASYPRLQAGSAPPSIFLRMCLILCKQGVNA